MKISGVVVLASGLLAGCGSASSYPPAAEPGVSPPLTEAPAGRVVELDGLPEGIAVDPRSGLVAIGLRNPDRLALLKGGTGKVVDRVKLPESPRHLQADVGTGTILVPAERANELVEVDPKKARISREVPVGAFPHDAAAAAGRVFVTDEMGDTLSVVEGDKVIESLPTAQQPGGVAASNDGVAVVAVAERAIELWDPETLERTAVANAGVGPTHVVAGPAGHFFVTDTQGEAVLVYRTEPNLQVIDRLNLYGSPYGIAVDHVNARLWVTQPGLNRIQEYRMTTRTLKPVQSLPTIRQPNSVAVDPQTGRVYVASRTDNQLQILDGNLTAGP